MRTREVKKMIRIEGDKLLLRRLCLDALATDDPTTHLEKQLIHFGLCSRREVHFCRGFLDAIAVEIDGNQASG